MRKLKMDSTWHYTLNDLQSEAMRYAWDCLDTIEDVHTDEPDFKLSRAEFEEAIKAGIEQIADKVRHDLIELRGEEMLNDMMEAKL